ncbi:chorismate mutase [Enterococcus alishanensis]|uniref:Chorismate mutase n=1 Tax=Enterococcus alishanensis TaxID=1303817 RepID=A0ABS6TET0_9ENTE|nr:chorismate mutase [Enterococcus alishanensis]MBV7391403.1 chorismate mutase [Enterococcus alishanensis]
MVTEKEKMIAGQLYFASDAELVADRAIAKKLAQAISQTEDKRAREELVKEAFGKTGERVYIEPNINFDYGYNIFVGENFYTNYNSILLDICPITIGNNCMFGPNVQLYTASHPLKPGKRNSGLELGKPITIGDNAWLGGGVVIVPGVTLGDNVVVAAGSVVTKSFGDNVVLGGNPAGVIKTIEEEKTTDLLAEARKQIDTVDQQLVQLLEKRMAAVSLVTEAKAESGQAVFDSSREAIVLEKIAQKIENPDFQVPIIETFKAIMEQSKDYQRKKLGDK